MPDKSKHLGNCNPARMLKHWRFLCEHIGERRAGTRGERAAADYLLEQFRRLGLHSVNAETFPCTSLQKSSVELRIEVRGGFRRVPARALVGAAPTPGGKEVSGELVWVEMPEQADRAFRQSVRGKILVLFGPLPTDIDLHQKMVSLKPAAVIHVDDRLPFEWLKDDGVYPVWARRYGMPPTISIPYRRAWDLKKLGAKRATLRVRLQQQESTSQNVVGEIPGRKPELPLVLVSAHHDTQCHNTGADDNASGVVAVLELAAMLSRHRPLRTVRFVSFGTEEQLSVGSDSYVKTHRSELSKIGAALNMDGLSSVLGHYFLFRAGSREFGETLTSLLAENGLDAAEHVEDLSLWRPFSLLSLRHSVNDAVAPEYEFVHALATPQCF